MGLRYIIIPLLILLYLWWWVRSIKEIRNEKVGFNLTDSTGVFIFHLILGLTILLGRGALELVELIIKYW